MTDAAVQRAFLQAGGEKVNYGLTLRLRQARVDAWAIKTFYFVAPTGLIRPAELPEGCGLIEVRISKSGWHDQTRMTVPAPLRETGGPSLSLLAELARRAK